MTPRTCRGRRGSSRLSVETGERYALIPREVMECEAYRAAPDWSLRVLLALAGQYSGHNNGSLALTSSQARPYGILPWKLYAGLRVLAEASFIVCTRRGHLAEGTKFPSMYAVTYRGINEPQLGISYDYGINVCPIPLNHWAKWQRPMNLAHRALKKTQSCHISQRPTSITQRGGPLRRGGAPPTPSWIVASELLGFERIRRKQIAERTNANAIPTGAVHRPYITLPIA